jgi:hypothetical protein
MTDGMALIRNQRGMLAKIAHGLGFTRAAVAKWSRVPAEYVVKVEEITGIPRHRLRPDLHIAPSRPCEAA